MREVTDDGSQKRRVKNMWRELIVIETLPHYFRWRKYREEAEKNGDQDKDIY